MTLECLCGIITHTCFCCWHRVDIYTHMHVRTYFTISFYFCYKCFFFSYVKLFIMKDLLFYTTANNWLYFLADLSTQPSVQFPKSLLMLPENTTVSMVTAYLTVSVPPSEKDSHFFFNNNGGTQTCRMVMNIISGIFKCALGRKGSSESALT